MSRRREFSFWRMFVGIMLFGTVALWGIAHLPDTSTTVSSNLDGKAPVTTRTLDPRVFPTTTIHPTTTTRPVDEITVIYGGHVIRVHRTAATQLLFTQLERLNP